MASIAGGSLIAALAAALAVCTTTGCSTASYYAQSVRGHLAILAAARPVPEWLADADTSPALKERLALAQRIRDFAVAELGLPDNASYRRYADLQRPAALWNVVAAPELSLQAKTWCFAFVGCVAYRGYYDRADAEALGAELRRAGLDVSVYGVPAYSTLGKLPQRGFLADPLLNTFIGDAETELARLVFHELAHQVAFAPGDTLFNESFATAVETIGERRWLAARRPGAGLSSSAEEPASAAAAASSVAVRAARRTDFRALVLEARAELDALYRSDAGDDAKRAGKAAAMARLRGRYEAIKATRWNGYAGYDGWFERANNATFATLANYTGLVPAFERLFEREGESFDRFYAEVRRLAGLPPAERRAALGAPS